MNRNGPHSSYNEGTPMQREATIFDLFFDLPHPAASSINERARIIEPPEIKNTAMLTEMYEPSSISRIARFAFPCHDDQEYAANMSSRSVVRDASISKIGGERAGSLNRYDFYLQEFSATEHTFALQLSDGLTRLHGHVLRYLPPRKDSKGRSDVGRRGARAMVLLTRATGGNRFYNSVLKSLESLMADGDGASSPEDWEDKAQARAMAFLHDIHKRHAQSNYEKMQQISIKGPGSLTNEDTILYLVGTEHGGGPGFGRDLRRDPRRQQTILPGDFLRFQLPTSLQAGFRIGGTPEDLDAPILPLLRCLGTQNTMRLISATLCECRIILVSASISRLSACTRATTAMLAQGLMAWQHIHIPILPPHLLKYLAAQTPYIVGLLERYIVDVELVPGLKDVLCIHLDKNQLRTFNMASPSRLVPDMLSKADTKKKASEKADKKKKLSEPGTSELLANDFDQILKAEKRVLGSLQDQKTHSIDKSDCVDQWNAFESTGKNIFRPRNKKGSWVEGNGALEDCPLPTLFGKVMRGESLRESSEKSPQGEMKSNSDHSILGTRSCCIREDTVRTFDVCNNERGEEEIRAGLTSFFLLAYGDLGTILSENPRDGSLWLDRKKYLLCKKREGNLENTPMFNFYKAFSGSSMLECYLQEKITELERDGEILIPRHRPLYNLCEKRIRINGIKFTAANVRRIVSTTIVGLPQHTIVERCEKSRAQALALTSIQPFDGNISQALSTLMNECHECNSALPQVMAVVWSRIEDNKSTSWKHPLLALHLIKNMLLHGPITSIALTMDGIDKIRNLRGYSAAKNLENRNEIRNSATQVYEMLVDRTRLFTRRRRALAVRAKLVDVKREGNWGNYMIHRLPFTAAFKQFHMLVRPRKESKPSFMSKTEFQTRKGKEVRQQVEDKSPSTYDGNDAIDDTDVAKNVNNGVRKKAGVSSKNAASSDFPNYLPGGATQSKSPSSRRSSTEDSKLPPSYMPSREAWLGYDPNDEDDSNQGAPASDAIDNGIRRVDSLPTHDSKRVSSRDSFQTIGKRESSKTNGKTPSHSAVNISSSANVRIQQGSGQRKEHGNGHGGTSRRTLSSQQPSTPEAQGVENDGTPTRSGSSSRPSKHQNGHSQRNSGSGKGEITSTRIQAASTYLGVEKSSDRNISSSLSQAQISAPRASSKYLMQRRVEAAEKPRQVDHSHI